MTAFAAIADDLTGACDVAAELALAGWQVRVALGPEAPATTTDPGDDLVIVNTQSRAIAASAAYQRVHDAVRARPARIVLKKIDTALRGHLGAELDGALDALGAPAFVLAAIPAAGRITRDGCQWFGDCLLETTEFARDPEGPGAVSSIAAVLGRESRRRAAVIGRAAVLAGRLAAEVARQRTEGIDVFVVDAETDDDVTGAVAAIMALGEPVCLFGSIALTAALAPHVRARRSDPADATRDIEFPALIVSGSLHSRARAQLDAVLATGRAVTVAPPATEPAAIAQTATAVATYLAAGTTVVVAAPSPAGTPTADALRATEQSLAELVTAVAAHVVIPTLVVIGGETSHAILTRLGATTLAVHGRIAPLIAWGTMLAGQAAGSTIITKGGSGGEPDVLARLVLGSGAERLQAGERR
ncbi:MAG: four-carbon acid sugar kinase family protein [Candidatus Binatia bacterium]